MKETIQILSALAEPTRLAALHILWDGHERCVCELMDALGKSQSCMSRHMTALKNTGLVIDRRDAQWVRYRKNPKLDGSIATLVEAALHLEKAKKRKNA